MENSPILRSLVAGGRSSGTGRPTSSSSSARATHDADQPRTESFQRHVDRARRDAPANERKSEAREADEERLERNEPRSIARDEAPAVETNEQPEPPSAQPSAVADGEPQGSGSATAMSSGDDSHALSFATQVDAAINENPDSVPGLGPDTTPNAASTTGVTSSAPLVAVLDEIAPQLAAATQSDASSLPTNTGELAGSVASAPSSVENAPRKPASSTAAQSSNTSNSTDAIFELPTEPAPSEAVEFIAPVSATDAEPSLPTASNHAGKESMVTPELSLASPAPDSNSRGADSSPATRAEPPTPSASSALDAERSAQVLRQVRLRLSPELRQAVIQLEPRELGRIAIRISVTRGVVRAELRAEHQATLDALERHAPELKAALERVGLATDAFALQLGFDGAADGNGRSNDSPRAANFGSRAGDPHEQPLTAAQMRSVERRLAAAGGVDTYA